ncbi:hypothetical protein K443DRAFT_92043, partial [Laccaria amethystina LaAM-08-1]
IAKDKRGKFYWKHAFNTQACEQLNSWLGGFESILKLGLRTCMTISNFNWFFHAILFYHTKYVIEKQKRKQNERQRNLNKSDDDDSNGDDSDDGDI